MKFVCDQSLRPLWLFGRTRVNSWASDLKGENSALIPACRETGTEEISLFTTDLANKEQSTCCSAIRVFINPYMKLKQVPNLIM